MSSNISSPGVPVSHRSPSTLEDPDFTQNKSAAPIGGSSEFGL